MSDKKQDRRGLGRGLSALMSEMGDVTATPEAARPTTRLPVDKIRPNPDQPRRQFDDGALAELAASIKEKGVIQPLIVRAKGDMYEIVAGERRWRAAQRAQLHDVPVVVKEFSDTEVLEIAIIENIQRADLNPLEEAMGYRALMDRFGHTQEKLAQAMGKSRSHIANLMRLLGLPEDVQAYLREGKLTAGHARALITVEDASMLARKAVLEGLSVRQVENLAKSGPVTPKAPRPKHPKDTDTVNLERDLSTALGLPVTIDYAGGGKGSITVTYKSMHELDRICSILGNPIK